MQMATLPWAHGILYGVVELPKCKPSWDVKYTCNDRVGQANQGKLKCICFSEGYLVDCSNLFEWECNGRLTCHRTLCGKASPVDHIE